MVPPVNDEDEPISMWPVVIAAGVVLVVLIVLVLVMVLNSDSSTSTP